MDNIFSNIGGKLQTLAKVIFVVTILCFVGVFCALLPITLESGGLLVLSFVTCAVLVPVSACLAAFPLYALGQLVDDIHQMRKETQRKIGSETDELPEL